jgi:hypothetical protein
VAMATGTLRPRGVSPGSGPGDGNSDAGSAAIVRPP